MTKNKANSPSAKEQENVATISKIDAIKELIFGENIQTYDSEFESIKEDLVKKKQELERIIEELRAELLQTIDSLNTDINIRITDLESNLSQKIEDLDEKKLDRKVLGALLTSIGDKISQ